MHVLAIVPARGGSKGIQRKNLVPFNGEPLVVHSIRQALRCKLITRVVVSTEDHEIRDCALASGAEVPFLRPMDLAGDQVLDLPVFRHVLDTLKQSERYVPSLVVHLRPTAPHRRPEWIDQAIQLLQDHADADSVRSVSLVNQHPYRTFRIKDGLLDPVMKHEHPAPHVLRRQDLPPIYYYNCVIDATRPATIEMKESMTGSRILPFVLDADEVIDIDSPRDLRVAQFLFGGP